MKVEGEILGVWKYGMGQLRVGVYDQDTSPTCM